MSAVKRKRPSAETDETTDLAKSQPGTKRQSTGSSTEESDHASDYWALTKQELVTLLKGRSLPISGNKGDLVGRLKENSSANKTGQAQKLGGQGPIDTKSGYMPIGNVFDYITVCRQSTDEAEEERPAETWIREEVGEIIDGNLDESDDESDKDENSLCGKKGCIYKQPASANPTHPWMLTKLGYSNVAYLQHEALRRDQDAIGEHFYSDYSGYGFEEVMENELVEFDKEIRKLDPSLAKLWSSLEGFAFTIDWTNTWWFNIDDLDRVLQTLRMIGVAVFTTLNVLKKNDLLYADTRVKNIALVLATLRDILEGWPSGSPEPELAWGDCAIEEAKYHGIQFKNLPPGMEAKLKTGIHRDQPGQSRANWAKLDWKKQFNAYRKRLGGHVGGKHYVITPGMQKTFGLESLDEDW